MMPARSQRRQRGAFSIFAAFGVILMLGSVGLAIDTGRMLVVRSELQSSMDACALSGVLELNGLSDSAHRAAAAGRFVGGQRNLQNFQASPITIRNEDVTFPANLNDPAPPTSDAPSASAARFIRCKITSPGIVPLLLSVLGVGDMSLTVSATAAVQSAQSVCAIPMAIMGNIDGGTDYGYAPGERITLGASGTRGFFQWANVADDPNVSSLSDYANAFIKHGSCGAMTAVGRCITTQSGELSSLDQYWNTRFGVYKSNGLTPAEAIPDLTGYGFADRPDTGYTDYQTIYAPQRTPAQASVIPPSYSVPANVNTTFGASYRRLTVMPVINAGDSSCGGTNGARRLIGWACVLMVSPIASNQNAQVEYLGPANTPNTMCRTAGMPGSFDGNGPLVPVLIK